jgi:hypothetical protein
MYPDAPRPTESPEGPLLTEGTETMHHSDDMMAPDTEPMFVRTKKAGPLIGFMEGTMIQWRHQGRGPAYFIPPGTRTVLYDVRELRRFVEAGRVQTAGAA